MTYEKKAEETLVIVVFCSENVEGELTLPPTPTQDPGSTVVEGSQLFTWRWGTPDK